MQKKQGPSSDNRSVLDLGCGPGTAILAAQSYLHPQCTYLGVDMSGSMIEMGEKIQASLPWKVQRASFLKGTFIPKGSFQLVFLSNVLSEIGLNG